jgi:trk system potassium uptake protein TrkA
VVLIDHNASRLEAIRAQLDILTIPGNGASPVVLEQAEISRADLLLAVTNKDEINIVACVYAGAVGVPHKVARITNTEHSHAPPHMDLRNVGPDLLICHKEETAREMFNVLRRPGTLEVIDLLDGLMLTIGLAITEDSPLCGLTLRSIPEERWRVSLRVVALLREGSTSVPDGETMLQAGDNIYAVMNPADVDDFLDWAHPGRMKLAKIVIAGAGEIGFQLAQQLEKRPGQVVLIEEDVPRAEFCSGKLERTLVIRGNTLDGETLRNIGIIEDTAFAAVTGDDENNIISCLLARKMGASFSMAKVTKNEYMPIIRELTLLDRIVSPQQTMVNAILHFVSGQNVRSATLLHRLDGEFIEMVMPSDGKWINKAIKDIRCPKETLIAAVKRGDEVYVPTGDLALKEGDELVVFAQPQAIEKIKAIFRK